MVEPSRINLAVLFFSVLGIAGFGSWLITRFSTVLGFVDYPEARSSHVVPTPGSGGIGIALAIVGAAVILDISTWFWASAAGMAMLGFCDDRLELSARFRLFVQAVFALIMILPLVGGSEGWWYLIPAGAIYIVGTANFFNFMDGVNGMAGFSGTVAFSLLAFFAIFSGDAQMLSPFMLCVVGACLGFLPFNFPRASVFMGDVGSLLLGSVFAGSVLLLTSNPEDFLVMNGFMLPFYVDTVSTLVIRWCKGEKITEAHRKHLYQILANEFKIPHWRVTLIYILCQLLTGLLMLAALGSHWWFHVLLIAAMTATFLTASLRLRKKASTLVCGGPVPR